MQAIILAGGLGTRLKPITEKIPKCMAPILGKPFLFYLLNLLRDRGVEEVVLCVGYLGEQVRSYFQDGSRLGLKIRYSQEMEKLLGTGGALKLAESLLQEKFLVINGDTYLNIDYNQTFNRFDASGKKALIVANRSINGERGDLEIDKSAIVLRYDKEISKNLGFVNAGTLVLRRDIVKTIEAGIPVSLEKEVLPLLIGQSEVIAWVTQEKFYDIGTFTNLRLFETHIQRG